MNYKRIELLRRPGITFCHLWVLETLQLLRIT